MTTSAATGKVSGMQALRNWLHLCVEVPLLLRLLQLPPGARVLEIGCGTGIGLRAMRLRGLSATGLDRHPCPGAVTGDAERLPFGDATFDLVVDFGVVQHLPDGAERALTEVARVLRPGGRHVCETTLAQLLAHPRRLRRGRLAWPVALAPERDLVLWQVRTRR